MTEEFSLPSLKCILEYLEAHKRIHIASRNNDIRKIEKSIPLRLNKLFIGPETIALNNIYQYFYEDGEEIEVGHEEYENKPDEEKLTPGDLYAGPEDPSWSLLRLSMDFDSESEFHRKLLPRGLKIDEAIRRMNYFYLENRKKIHVQMLDSYFWKGQIFRAPSGFKVFARKLCSSKLDFHYMLPIIDESSFPFEELETFVSDQSTLQHSLLKSAKKLTLHYNVSNENFRILNGFENLLHKNLVIRNENIPENKIMEFVNYLVSHGRDNGTIWEIRRPIAMVGLIKSIKSQYSWKGVNPENLDERYIRNTDCVSISMNSTSELCIYEVHEEKNGSHDILLKMEVVPIGSLNYLEPEYAAAIPYLALNIGIMLSLGFLTQRFYFH